jgi:23S rRNA pseudouridine2605 synthase
MVAEGRVRVNGLVVRELGAKADPFKDKVELDGKRVVAETPVYIVVHKPRGVVSTMNDPEGRPSMKEILDGIGKRVFPVGRLDFATSGVLLAHEARRPRAMADGCEARRWRDAAG